MFWAALMMSAAAVVCALVAPPSELARSNLARYAKDDRWKDEQMNDQYEMLARRRNSKKREDYFSKVFEKRQQATKDQYEKWRFQRDDSADPLIAWKKMREKGEIGDLKTGLGTDGEKREGGIPLPLPSFGVGGEAGVGGQYDNGERFDLRLPYVDQGYVDPEADVMGKLVKFFKGEDKKEEEPPQKEEQPQSSFRWPWEK